MSVLASVKTLLEIDIDEPIYDAQLLAYINGGLAYLKNNGIPVGQIDETAAGFAGLRDDDAQIVISWLHLYTLQRFDRTLMTSTFTATQNWIDGELANLIGQLKARYDNEIVA
jgi:hypothetical protein